MSVLLFNEFDLVHYLMSSCFTAYMLFSLHGWTTTRNLVWRIRILRESVKKVQKGYSRK